MVLEKGLERINDVSVLMVYLCENNPNRDELGQFASGSSSSSTKVKWGTEKNSRVQLELFKGDESVGSVEILTDVKGVAQTEGLEIWKEHRGKGYAIDLYTKAIKEAKKKGFKVFSSSENLTEGGERVWLSLKKRGFPVERIKTGAYTIDLSKVKEEGK
jgi:predicted GNAT family acetyltransferase